VVNLGASFAAASAAGDAFASSWSFFAVSSYPCSFKKLWTRPRSGAGALGCLAAFFCDFAGFSTRPEVTLVSLFDFLSLGRSPLVFLLLAMVSIGRSGRGGGVVCSVPDWRKKKLLQAELVQASDRGGGR